MHYTVKAQATLAPNSFPWTSFKWKLYNYNPCETLPLWWGNWDFFNVKHALLVMQLLMLHFFSFLLRGEKLFKVCFASKCTIAKIMAAIKLSSFFFPLGPHTGGPWDRVVAVIFFPAWLPPLTGLCMACWHNSLTTYHNHLPFTRKHNPVLWLGNYCVCFHIVVSPPCW